MTNIWWKILVLQVLLAAVLCLTESEEFENNSKQLSNDNIMLLFKRFLEDKNNQQATKETNDKNELIKKVYHLMNVYPFLSMMSLYHKQNKEMFTENQIKNEDLQQFLIEYIQSRNNIENVMDKKIKKQYVTKLCHFKICNQKRSTDNYDKDYDYLIRYMTKGYNQ